MQDMLAVAMLDTCPSQNDSLKNPHQLRQKLLKIITAMEAAPWVKLFRIQHSFARKSYFLCAKGVQDRAVIKSLINQLIKAKAAG